MAASPTGCLGWQSRSIPYLRTKPLHPCQSLADDLQSNHGTMECILILLFPNLTHKMLWCIFSTITIVEKRYCKKKNSNGLFFTTGNLGEKHFSTESVQLQYVKVVRQLTMLPGPVSSDGGETVRARKHVPESKA